MTGKQAKIVKAAYARHMSDGARLAAAMNFRDWDDWREHTEQFLRAKYRPYPRYAEQMAALGEPA